MKTNNSIYLKALLTLLDYYKYKRKNIDYSVALFSLFKKDLIGNDYRKVADYIYNKSINTSNIKYLFIVRFTSDPVKQRIRFITYCINKLDKKDLKDVEVYLYIPSLDEYIYFHHGSLLMGDINSAQRLTLAVAKETQSNIELDSIIKYR